MADRGLRITVEDLQTGETDSRAIVNDVCVIVHGTCHITHVQDHPRTGTQVITVKGRGSRRASSSAGPPPSAGAMAEARIEITADAPAIARLVALVARRAVAAELTAWRARIIGGADRDELLSQLDARLADIRAGGELLVRTGLPAEDIDWRQVAVKLASRDGAWFGLSTREADALRDAIAETNDIAADPVAEPTTDAPARRPE
ncbi:MAG TPA: hypothetical protein VGX25_13425 [Actinophytocola sp.]|uniref:hypothetical protein n=1 Tax=Actinophytocola sp. TaxID=1872138 RepID=UPI002DDC92C6|nr:hypothetical protein [Actinophytocola sp.]HEV2780384.1 hypothetical protein [Actinophytocola sp.]